VPTITRLRARGPRQLAVELDGQPWRVVPAEAVLAAGLDVGDELDRERARRLRRELVRLGALSVAASALTRRERSARALAERLERVGTPPAARRRTIEVLQEAGLLDDARVARARAVALAERGYGDAAIDADLERQGIAAELRAEALERLAPERERLGLILERRGFGAATARYVAARGFGEESIAAAAGVDFANDA
jgi:SOS response regulatory protein OraA/RecX